MAAAQDMRNWLILGGGISGLAAARHLDREGQQYSVLEKCPSPGGLTRTVEASGFCFDYTGHFLNLVRSSSPEGLPLADLNDDDWIQVNRRSSCHVLGKLVRAPLQYHLADLPEQVLHECVRSYETRPPLPSNAEASFRDFVVSGFGEYFADLFLIPLNEKTLRISLDRLSSEAAKRFFPSPDEGRVRAGIRGDPLPPTGYNQTFWYPKSGGISKLVCHLRLGLDGILTNQEAHSVDLRDRSVVTSEGDRFSWDILLSSIPLKNLCEMSNDTDLVNAATKLGHSTTITFNFGIQGDLPLAVRDTHWIYVPDQKIPFYRVGFYSNISAGTCTPGHSSMYVECSVDPSQISGDPSLTDLQVETLDWLERLGWIDPRSLVCVVAHTIPCAYVHHTPDRDQVVTDIFKRLESYSVYPIGRYGLWDYITMEDSIYSAASMLETLL